MPDDAYKPAPGNGQNPVLRRGDHGPAVASWQKIINVAADGVFGEETEKATRVFQMMNGLKPDGLVGPQTWARAAMLSQPQPDPSPDRPLVTRLPAKRTKVTPEELYASLAKLAPELSRDALLVLLGHWGLETADGAGCWGYNLGNVKGRPGGSDGRSWQFFACNEILSPSAANAIVARAGDREPRRPDDDPAAFGRPEFDKVSKSAVTTSTTANGLVVLWAFPPDPVCCFRAFRTLDEGTADYLALLKKQFASSWPFVVAGDTAGFAHALKVKGYYTADEAQYTKALKGRRDKFAKLIQ
jgi:peptidoglycan hydrolase-like protein with peptidoglycan-binding domain